MSLRTAHAAAATGAREDALMLAMTMVRADRAPAVVAAAEATGVALRRLCLRAEGPGRLH